MFKVNFITPKLQLCIRACQRRSLTTRTHYEILNLPKNATNVQIKEAFFSLSKQLHPDVNQGNPNNHNQFVRLNEAYMVLSKFRSRHLYDLSLAAGSYNQNNISNKYNNGNVQNYQRYTEFGNPYWNDPYKRSKNSEEAEDHYNYSNKIRRHRKKVSLESILICLALLVSGNLYFFLAYWFTLAASKKRRETNRLDIEEILKSSKNIDLETKLRTMSEYKK